MGQAVRLSFCLLAIFCEHSKLLLQFSVDYLETFQNHSWYVVVHEGWLFYVSFPNRVMYLFQISAYVYIASSCEHNSSYSFQWIILKPSRIVTQGTQLCVKAGFFMRPFRTELCPLKYFLMTILGRIMLWQAVLLFDTCNG